MPIDRHCSEIIGCVLGCWSACAEAAAFVSQNLSILGRCVDASPVPPSGVIFSEVFAQNVATLFHYLGFGHRSPLSQ
jgi:hypothetical protein